MSWVRLDDNFHWHPKVAPLSDAAYRLYIGALCYCNRYNQGGRVTTAHVAILAGAGRRTAKLIAELVLATLWDSDGADWIIHDYFLYQPDPAKQAAGRVGGQASAQARAQAGVKQDSKHGAQASAQPPSRTRPVPLGVLTPVTPQPVENPEGGDGAKALTKRLVQETAHQPRGEMTPLSAHLPKLEVVS